MLLHVVQIIHPISSLAAVRRDVLTQLVALGAVAGAAAIAYFFAIRQRRMDEKKATCARAVTDALAWLELPYRIRRRMNSDPETLHNLADQMHQLQERLLFDQNWMLVELLQAERSYSILVAAVKQAAEQPLRDAWLAPPVENPSGMNIGSLGIPSVESELRSFASDARRRLSWWKLWQE
ncbi:MAG: hypothetical protein KGK07_07505 [Chloroflexota bacterium]|nr:hypothetical protein [Chloroflexota bacterium]